MIPWTVQEKWAGRENNGVSSIKQASSASNSNLILCDLKAEFILQGCAMKDKDCWNLESFQLGSRLLPGLCVFTSPLHPAYCSPLSQEGRLAPAS